jgi:hypothetical protein
MPGRPIRWSASRDEYMWHRYTTVVQAITNGSLVIRVINAWAVMAVLRRQWRRCRRV